VYDELYEAWRIEKENREVKPLPKDFFVRLMRYVKRLREEMRMLDEKTTRAKLLVRESKNVKKLGGELILLRYKKVLQKMLNGETVSKDSLTESEEKLLRETFTLAESYQDFLKGVLSGRLVSLDVKKPAPKRVLRFLKEIPAIIGADMKTYGPFKPEDVATVPAENAEVLLKQGLAVEVEVEV
jgi:DNA replication initiation complex subunit (GINS family)